MWRWASSVFILVCAIRRDVLRVLHFPDNCFALAYPNSFCFACCCYSSVRCSQGLFSLTQEVPVAPMERSWSERDLQAISQQDAPVYTNPPLVCLSSHACLDPPTPPSSSRLFLPLILIAALCFPVVPPLRTSSSHVFRRTGPGYPPSKVESSRPRRPRG